jgi:hypothetical protein
MRELAAGFGGADLGGITADSSPVLFALRNVNEYVNFPHVHEINFYRIANGTCPVEEFLDSLTGKQAQKVAWTMQLIEELDRVPGKYLEKMTGTDNL